MPNVVITSERKAGMAILLLRVIIREKGFLFNRSELKRYICGFAKETGLNIEEVTAYYEEEIRLAVDEMFGSPTGIKSAGVFVSNGHITE